MFCAKCGNKLEDDAVFCDECGARIERKQPPFTTQNQYYQEEKQSFQAGETFNKPINLTNHRIEKHSLDGWEIAFCIMSALSSLFALITCDYVYNWVTFVCAGFMVYLFIKKEKYNTILMALPFTFYFAKELIYWIATKAPTLKYQDGFTAFIAVLTFILDLAAVIGYWFIVRNKLQYKRIILWVIIAMLSLNLFGILLLYFMGYVYTFVTVLYSLSMALFLLTYLLMILRSEKTYMCNKSI